MSLRDEFPVLSDCTYLNSNSTGALPRGISAVLAEYGAEMLAWRDERWASWLPLLDRYHASLERLLGASPGTVMSDASSSVLLSRVLSCFDFRERPRVVTTNREFPSAGFLLRALARYGAEVVVVDVAGEDPEGALAAALDERTCALVASHGGFQTGALLDLAVLQARCRARGVVFVVDAYQTVGTVPIDVAALELDVVLGGAHKWLCGSTETAFVYVRPELLTTLEPAFTGWVATDAPFGFTPRHAFAPTAWRFAGGTPQVLPARISQIGLDLLLELGIDAIRIHSLACTDRIVAHADEARIEVLTPRAPERRGGIVALRFEGDLEVCRRLVHQGFVCSHRGGLRIAPHAYNTLSEIDEFFEALHGVRRELS